MLGQFQGWQLVILIVVVLLLFFAKRLPDAARSAGRSMRIFRSEVKGMKGDDGRAPSETTSPQAVEGTVHRAGEPAGEPVAEHRQAHESASGTAPASGDQTPR